MNVFCPLLISPSCSSLNVNLFIIESNSSFVPQYYTGEFLLLIKALKIFFYILLTSDFPSLPVTINVFLPHVHFIQYSTTLAYDTVLRDQVLPFYT